MSQDPVGFTAGDGNLYRYVNNAPTSTLDPSGLQGLVNNDTLSAGHIFGLGGGSAQEYQGQLLRAAAASIAMIGIFALEFVPVTAAGAILGRLKMGGRFVFDVLKIVDRGKTLTQRAVAATANTGKRLLSPILNFAKGSRSGHNWISEQVLKIAKKTGLDRCKIIADIIAAHKMLPKHMRDNSLIREMQQAAKFLGCKHSGAQRGGRLP